MITPYFPNEKTEDRDVKKPEKDTLLTHSIKSKESHTRNHGLCYSYTIREQKWRMMGGKIRCDILKKHLYLKIIVDSHAVVRMNKERSYIHPTKIPPKVTSCRTIVQSHNWDTDSQTVNIWNTSIITGSLMLPFDSHTWFPSNPYLQKNPL